MSGRDNEALLEKARQGDTEAFDLLLSNNSGLIWSIARRFFGRGVDADDLFQLGCLGFVKAVRGFDSSFGTRFSTYAVPMIMGEIRRFLRDDGPVKISRSIREASAKVASARNALEADLGREPRLSELADRSGLSPEDVAACEIACAPVTSLQQPVGDDDLTLESAVGSEAPEDGIIEIAALREAIETLPKREREVIYLRYYKGMTQQSAARVLAISQVQVSRVEKRAVEMLRKKIV